MAIVEYQGVTLEHSPNKEPTVYTRVVPDLVVEARVDAATLGGERWRHGSRFIRVRPDLTVDDVPRELDLELLPG